MGWTPFQWIIVTLMLVTGSLNTLMAKWTDLLTAKGRDGKECRTDVPSTDPSACRSFNHPFVQACAMFLGEFLCLFAFFILWFINRRKNNGTVEDAQSSLGDNQERFTWKKAFIFLPPAMLDMTGTSVMYVGLNLTYASSFQMLRGAVIIFTALLSVAFLNRSLSASKWIGMIVVISGLALVGVSDIVFGDRGANNDINGIITGDLLIIMAQIVAACQMVYEEKFLSKYNVPALLVVGLEGLFGFLVLSLLLVPFSYIPVPSGFSDSGVLEDAIDAFVQMSNNKLIVVGLVGTVFSIAFFNYAGVSVTKELNATTRMLMDSMRTLIIWAVSLGLQWQHFQYLQVPGFLLLILGMMIYNQILNVNLYRRLKARILRRTDEDDALIDTDN